LCTANFAGQTNKPPSPLPENALHNLMQGAGHQIVIWIWRKQLSVPASCKHNLNLLIAWSVKFNFSGAGTLARTPSFFCLL